MNHLKNPEFRTSVGGTRALIDNALQQNGFSLPCHVVKVDGAMITVAFDVQSIYSLPQVTVPLFGPEYVRYPIKDGDLGVLIPIDTSIGFTAGTAPRPPNLSPYSQAGGLEGLFFMPTGNKNWVPVDPNQVTVYAPNGVTLRDTNSGAVIVLHPTQITITVGSCTITMDSSTITMTAPSKITLAAPQIELDGQMTQGTTAGGYPATLQGPVTVIHEVTANGIPVSTHEHGGVQPGSGNTGPPHA
jgi:hypothetical protein